MGYSLEGAVTPNAGFTQGFILVGVITAIGGLLGVFLINPKADRERLARVRVAPPLAAVIKTKA